MSGATVKETYPSTDRMEMGLGGGGGSRIVEEVDETGREDAAPARLEFDVAGHPVLVLGLFDGDDEHFALAERQLVVVVGLAVVQRPAAAA